MKKLLSLVLALALAALMGTSALAEAPELNLDDITNLEKTPVAFEERDASSFSLATSDIVTIEGNTTTVNNGGVTFVLDLDPTLGFFVLTQDLVASVSNYFRLADPEGACDTLIETGTHLLLLQPGDGTQLWVHDRGTDGPGQMVGTLDDSVSEVMQQAYLAAFEEAFGTDKGELYQAGGHVWMRLADTEFVTFEGGHWIQVCWARWTADGTRDAMSEDDVALAVDALDCLTSTANE